MIKFTIDSKELKGMIDKAMAAINKKASIASLTKVYFQMEDNTLKLLGTDLAHYIELSTDSVYNTENGCIGIDVSDIGIITKMTGTITVQEISNGSDIRAIDVRCGKKVITIPGYKNTDISLPLMENDNEIILKVKENWLLETLVNLSVFTSNTDTNKLLNCFNFNTKHKRIEALDGHRIGMRTLENTDITTEKNSALLHVMCVPVLKKSMNKKSEDAVVLVEDNKYIKLVGNDFVYMQRKVDGQYFDIGKMLSCDGKNTFEVNAKQAAEVMKYNYELVKGDDRKRPTYIHMENGNLYSYIRTVKYTSLDEMEVINANMSDDTYAGYNPYYLMEVFNIIDVEYPLCRFDGEKSPLFIDGEEYSFLVLPIGNNDRANTVTEVTMAIAKNAA